MDVFNFSNFNLNRDVASKDTSSTFVCMYSLQFQSQSSVYIIHKQEVELGFLDHVNMCVYLSYWKCSPPNPVSNFAIYVFSYT